MIVTITRGRLILIITIIVGVAGWFTWQSRGWIPANLPPSALGPWVAFGDSLTEGYGASPGADYPSQLSKRLGVPIQNLGVSGDTSGSGLRRLPDIEAVHPRVVLLCFGGNDVLQNIRREVMIANVRAMVERLHAQGCFVVLIGVRGASVIGDSNGRAFKRIARETRALYVPNILDEVFSEPSLMSDYIHPNDDGHAKIANRVARALDPYLPTLRTP